jgi:hypothetical protein
MDPVFDSCPGSSLTKLLLLSGFVFWQYQGDQQTEDEFWSTSV